MFQFDVNRKIVLLNQDEIKNKLGIYYQETVKSVGYQSVNELKNTGEKEWTKENGLLSIWLLGMFNP
ncbi:MAG: hypothetical protein HOG79_06025, partial [Prolixibacteraceae bacterium]|nr:hypothetical protein [Prolixibacteraceae bacterium]